MTKSSTIVFILFFAILFGLEKKVRIERLADQIDRFKSCGQNY